ncbi:MAG: thioredoxin [Bdellovibrionota bacterium]
MALTEISDTTFETEVLQSSSPVLVDFWATWCGPCKALSPKLEEMSHSYVGKVKFAKMDVDSNREVPARFGIRGIPTLILFKNGKMLDQIVGNQPREVIEELLNKAL